MIFCFGFVLKLRFHRSPDLKISKSSYDLQSARIIIAAWSSFTIVECCECSVKKWPILVIFRFLHRTFSLVRFIRETLLCIFFITLSIPDNKLDCDNATISKSREKEMTAISLNSEVFFPCLSWCTICLHFIVLISTLFASLIKI